MAKPAWHDDFLICYPALLERLQSISEIKLVGEAKDLDQVLGDNEIAPSDNAAYLMWDSLTPVSEDGQRENTLQIGFSVVLSKQQYTPKPKIDGIGQMTAAIYKALNGFDPVNEKGQSLVSKAFRPAKPLPIRFKKGFGFFPMRFVAEVVVRCDDT